MKNRTLRILATFLVLLCAVLPLFACGSEEGGSDGFAFKTPGGVKIAVGDSDKVIADLGEYLSKNESASCGGIPGNDCVYAYSGFRVKTTPTEGGKNVICQIQLTDDSVETPEGLCIGMSVDDAKAAMSGKGTLTESGAGITYTKGNSKLQISVSGGYVTGISYLTK